MTTDDMIAFLQLSLSRAGADSLITPREMLRDYMTILNILMQNNNVTFSELLKSNDNIPTDASNKSGKPEDNNSDTNHKTYNAEDIEF